MKSVKELRKKAATRAHRKSRIYSTSEARANFAEALETAQVEGAVIGFDRYGRTVAALVPVEAVYILAGQDHLVSPARREALVQAARRFVAEVPSRLSARAEALSKPERAKPSPKSKATARKKKTAKSVAAKRPAKGKRNHR